MRWFFIVCCFFARSFSSAGECSLRENPVGKRFYSQSQKLTEACLPKCDDHYDVILEETETSLLQLLRPLGFDLDVKNSANTFDVYQKFIDGLIQESENSVKICKAKKRNEILECLNVGQKKYRKLLGAQQEFENFRKIAAYKDLSKNFADMGLPANTVCLLRQNNLFKEAAGLTGFSNIIDAEKNKLIVDLILEKLYPQLPPDSESRNFEKLCENYKKTDSVDIRYPSAISLTLAKYCM